MYFNAFRIRGGGKFRYELVFSLPENLSLQSFWFCAQRIVMKNTFSFAVIVCAPTTTARTIANNDQWWGFFRFFHWVASILRVLSVILTGPSFHRLQIFLIVFPV